MIGFEDALDFFSSHVVDDNLVVVKGKVTKVRLTKMASHQSIVFLFLL